MRIRERAGSIGAGAAVLALLLSSSLDGPRTEANRPAQDPPPAVDALASWDDVVWERVDAASLGGPLTQSPVAIVRGGPGFVVVGQDADGIVGAERPVGAIWTSTDARSWVKRRIVDGVPPGDSAGVTLAIGGPAGVLVAGVVCCSVETPAMWLVSDDQVKRLVLPEGMRSVSFRDIDAGPAGFVAGGARTDGNPDAPRSSASLWHSADGRTWTEVDRLAADLGPGDVRDVAWTGAAWFAVGSRDDEGRADGAVWRSADGGDWRRIAVRDAAIAGPEEEMLQRIVPFPGGLFVQGGSGLHKDRVACEDLAGEGTVGIPGARLSLGCSWVVSTHWTSRDGTTWRRAPAVQAPFNGPPLPMPPGGRRLVSHRVLDAGGPGLVVVDAEEPRRADGSDSVGTWISADGASWRPVGAPGQLPKDVYLQDMVVSGRTIVGIDDDGWDQPNGSDIVVWIGTFRP